MLSLGACRSDKPPPAGNRLFCRAGLPDAAEGSGRGDCRTSVKRLCPLADSGFLAGGDGLGFLSIWDLAGPSVAHQTRLHQGAITGLRLCDADVLGEAAFGPHIMQ